MLSLASKRLVGAGVIVAGIVLIALAVIQPNPFRTTTVYWAEFDSAHGLGAIGRDVRIAGMNAGTIGDVRREGDNAVVQLVLTEDIPIRTDARADMRPHTLFEGSSFIDLAPGSPSAPVLEPGETIPNERTSNYVTLDEAFRILRPEIRRSLRRLAETGSKTLRGEAIEGIQRTLANAPGLTRSLRRPARALQGSSRRELSGAIRGMARTVEAVGEQEGELIPLARRLNRTATAITVDEARPLDATLAALPGALRELQAGAPELTGLVDRLDRLAGEVTPALPDLTVALHEIRPLLERSIPILQDAAPLIRKLRLISGRLADAVPTLADLIETLDPVTITFGESVLPVLLEPSRTGPPVYSQLLATFTAANAVFRPYQTETQNPNGAGHVWNIVTYFDLLGAAAGEAGGGMPRAACADVRRVSPRAARSFEAWGGCG